MTWLLSVTGAFVIVAIITAAAFLLISAVIMIGISWAHNPQGIFRKKQKGRKKNERDHQSKTR